jgi:group I intron endonuclease
MQANTVGSDPIIKKDIYIIKNKINDKVYIGQAKDTHSRFISHCKKSSANGTSIIDKAIQKYGPENFWYEIIEEQVQNYNDREKYWISVYNSIIPNGYNIGAGGEEPPVHFGINHPLSMFGDAEDVISVKNDLRNTTLSMSEIAKRHNVSKRTVMRINKGEHYSECEEEYPIRKVPLSSFKLNETSVMEIVDILKSSLINYEDIAKKYNVSISTIKNINAGTMWHFDDESYPIRKYKNSGRPSCDYEQLTVLHSLITKTDMSYADISRETGLNDNVVYNVCLGKSKRYRLGGYTYPLRPINYRKEPVSTIPRKGSTPDIDTTVETETS